ncbi:hypothetical protein [Xanthomonas arboricola]|uniref:Uncharacterized protein n=1 Tax=Xanthomonas arboricola TaxID=56448 RepID=A0AB73H2G6_9XANT|nr:hypothetical protein [Xanthomonas arboricola]MBB5672325.1 hypothetical protein [Xanthomonas arboricola]
MDLSRLHARVCERAAGALHPSVVAAGLKHPGDMAQAVFLALQAICEDQEMAVAQGRDCVPGFDAEVSAVSTLLDAAPWTMHPDYGCVLSAEVEAPDGGFRA